VFDPDPEASASGFFVSRPGSVLGIRIVALIMLIGWQRFRQAIREQLVFIK
jgi:hypothetical protein